MIACRPYDHVVPLDYSLVPIMPMYWVYVCVWRWTVRSSKPDITGSNNVIGRDVVTMQCILYNWRIHGLIFMLGLKVSSSLFIYSC